MNIYILFEMFMGGRLKEKDRLFETGAYLFIPYFYFWNAKQKKYLWMKIKVKRLRSKYPRFTYSLALFITLDCHNYIRLSQLAYILLR